MYIQMARVQPGITLEHDIWQKFKNQYKNGEASKELERLIKKDLDDIEYRETIQILNASTLTGKQEALARKLISNNNFPYSKQEVSKIARDNRIYNRSDFVKTANETLAESPQTPFKMENGKLHLEEIECNCGVTNGLAALEKLDYECPNCDARFELGVE